MLCETSTESEPGGSFTYQNNSLTLLTEEISDLARRTGQRILSVYDSAYEVWQKTDHSPVTSADMLAHHTIVEGLRRLTPDIPILSEESANIPYAKRKRWEQYWLVDPLDGTREFIRHTDEFTVNIALIEDQQPVLGVIYVPVTGTLYYAHVDGGAYKQLPGQLPKPINVRLCADNCVVVAGSRSRNTEKIQSFIHLLATQVRLLGIGSSLKSCLVAEGQADIYPCFGPTSEWDTAAAQCILEQAGGYLTDTHLRPLRYNTKASLLNPYFAAFGDEAKKWGDYLLMNT